MVKNVQVLESILEKREKTLLKLERLLLNRAQRRALFAKSPSRPSISDAAVDGAQMSSDSVRGSVRGSAMADGVIDDLESARRRARCCGTGLSADAVCGAGGCRGTGGSGGREGPMAALSEKIRWLEEELLEMNEAGESATVGRPCRSNMC